MLRSLLRPVIGLFFLGTLMSVGFALEPKPGGPAAKAADLPLKQAVIFNSGVGFFQREGEVDGNAAIELRFNVDSINDLLKSMVLEDLGGGRVGAVNYGSRDPVTKTLQTFSINLTDNPTLGQILNQARGEEIELEAIEPIKGSLLGVERRKKETGKDHESQEVEYLNVLTESGLRSVALDGVSRIRFVDARLDGELRQALKTLALAHSNDKKTVTLNFEGQGKRPVRVGYIQEAPVWKTSYRLVLADTKAPFLQGWAIVENTTEEDWNNVQLTLVGGRPISFAMDLYQPLYNTRPIVQQALFASLRPRVYDQNIRDNELFARNAARGPMSDEKDSRQLRAGEMAAGKALGLRSDSAHRSESSSLSDGLAYDYSNTKLNLAENGGNSQARASDVGELFQYAIATPVTLPRQQSAMLPIVNEEVQGEKVSIYNQQVLAKHPLNGLRLKNSTALHLTAGPITVFDGSAYAGDAQIEDMQPGAERLLSYAVDLDLEVAPQAVSQPDEFVSARIAHGVLTSRTKQTRTFQYRVKNSGKKAKNLLVELPIEGGWKLVGDKKPAETTRDKYRFAVSAEPDKKTTELKVDQEFMLQQEVRVVNISGDMIAFYLRQKNIAPAVQKALEEIVRRQQTLAATVEHRKSLEAEAKTVDDEQGRIRQNMDRLDRNSDLYKRYVKKFADQEDQIEKLRKEIQATLAQEAQSQKDLDAFILSIDVG